MMRSKFILGIAVIAAVVSILGASLTYYSVNQFKETWLTGYAGSQGFINLTVETVLQINFTDDNINFGSGRVLSGASVTLNTAGPTFQTSNGNFTNETSGFVIENIGNVNASLNLSVGKTAAAFLGGTSPAYQWNLSNNEAGSCLNATGGTSHFQLPGTSFNDTATAQTKFCPIFRFADAADAVRVDIRLVVPSDSLTGALSDIITATAYTPI